MRLVAVLVPAEHRAAVAQALMKAFSSPSLSRVMTIGWRPIVGGEVVVVVRNLALVGEIDPVALEDVLHLQFEQLGVGEDVAAAAIDAVFAILDDGMLDAVSDGGGHCVSPIDATVRLWPARGRGSFLLLGGPFSRGQHEIEGDLAVRGAEAGCMDLGGVVMADDGRDQFVARGEGEVVVQVRIVRRC